MLKSSAERRPDCVDVFASEGLPNLACIVRPGPFSSSPVKDRLVCPICIAHADGRAVFPVVEVPEGKRPRVSRTGQKYVVWPKCRRPTKQQDLRSALAREFPQDRYARILVLVYFPRLYLAENDTIRQRQLEVREIAPGDRQHEPLLLVFPEESDGMEENRPSRFGSASKSSPAIHGLDWLHFATRSPVSGESPRSRKSVNRRRSSPAIRDPRAIVPTQNAFRQSRRPPGFRRSRSSRSCG